MDKMSLLSTSIKVSLGSGFYGIQLWKLGIFKQKHRYFIKFKRNVSKEFHHHIHFFYGCLSNIQFLPDVDNQMKSINCVVIEESDIPILMGFLASPRTDGKQRVMKIYFISLSAAEVLTKGQKFLDAMINAMKEEFCTSTQSPPQPFFLQFQFQTRLNIAQSEDQNPQTDETLTITPGRYNLCVDICRHPRGQYEQWAEDARERLIVLPIDNSETRISVDISDFGMPFCSP